MKNNNIFHIFAMLIFLAGLSGCVSIESATLPATTKTAYEFPAYTFTPLDNPKWRYLFDSQESQSAGFIHADHQTWVITWITPTFKHLSMEEKGKDAIDYFQNEILKALKKSPDITLSKEAMEREEITADGRSFQKVTINYTIDETDIRFVIYYYLDEDTQLLYNLGYLTDLTFNKNRRDDWQTELDSDIKSMLGRFEFLQPDKEDIISLRVNYTREDFNESVEDRYLKEKQESIQEKFAALKDEINEWISLKDNNYQGYYHLAQMYLFNEKFEKFGEGFDRASAEKYLKEAMAIRPNFKDAHVLYGQMLMELKEYPQALEHFKTAINISPNDDDLYYKAGQIAEEMNQTAQAKKYYQQAIRYWNAGQETMKELEEKVEKLKNESDDGKEEMEEKGEEGDEKVDKNMSHQI